MTYQQPYLPRTPGRGNRRGSLIGITGAPYLVESIRARSTLTTLIEPHMKLVSVPLKPDATVLKIDTIQAQE